MKTEIKIYKIKDFVRKTVSGEIDMNKSMAFVKQFADIAYVHPDHNILLDMRDTEVTNANITDMMKISLEFANSLPDFKNQNLGSEKGKSFAESQMAKAVCQLPNSSGLFW